MHHGVHVKVAQRIRLRRMVLRRMTNAAGPDVVTRPTVRTYGSKDAIAQPRTEAHPNAVVVHQ